MAIRPQERQRENLRRLLEMARSEDLGPGDVTSTLVPPEARAAGRFLAREPLVVCGVALLGEMAAAYDTGIRTTALVEEGTQVDTGSALAEWRGPVRAILSAERVALNFLQRLSGVASCTRRYVDAVAGTGAGIYDTRKTTPGWRDLEKYAVRVGGGRNHRRGLHDAVLVKDNHLAALAKRGEQDPITALAEQLDALRQRLGDDGFIELEVDTLQQLRAALTLPVDIVLLDNMSPDQLRQAVALRDEVGARGRIALEASGGVTLETVRQVAETGVERIAVGAITHSAPAVDIALDIEID